ncbi:hypothetical protein [Asticcacaulis sp. 201]|uniref:hypothetical protein n=1 Tax=Asticcacaulis sp. 201 TaxID=3028787 RepID=UPI002915FBD7|nr:hypothetical protein [Asticcacaulis sp. 201]MDV6329575.1 hypothetical protein [Asticcacaulis sp. 201]
MTILILKSLALMLGAFLVSAWVGWTLARRAKSDHSAFERPRAVFDDAPVAAAAAASKVGDETPAEKPAVQPVSYLDAAAEAFTSGVVVPFKPEPKSLETDKAPYAPPQPAPRLDMVAASATPGNVLIRREDLSLQRRASSLATMTPDSIAAAVQQAGTGLEPIRLGVPQSPPDDLTVISGIDAAKQRELNGLGIYYYWQVAGWSPENVAWISTRILSPDRAVRENWMSQAARLARML